MYVIGTNELSFIKINTKTLINHSAVYEEVYKVLYKCDLGNATIFKNREDTFKTIKEIKSRKDEILFENNNIIESILDKGKEFNTDKLKVYCLTPLECKIED